MVHTEGTRLMAEGEGLLMVALLYDFTPASFICGKKVVRPQTNDAPFLCVAKVHSITPCLLVYIGMYQYTLMVSFKSVFSNK